MGITVLTIIPRSKSFVSSLVRSRPFVRSRRVASVFLSTSLSFVRSFDGGASASRVARSVPLRSVLFSPAGGRIRRFGRFGRSRGRTSLESRREGDDGTRLSV